MLSGAKHPRWIPHCARNDTRGKCSEDFLLPLGDTQDKGGIASLGFAPILFCTNFYYLCHNAQESPARCATRTPHKVLCSLPLCSNAEIPMRFSLIAQTERFSSTLNYALQLNHGGGI